jgi:subtilisin family serine protease
VTFGWRRTSLALALAAGLALAPPAAARDGDVAVIVQVRAPAAALTPVAPSAVAASLRQRARHDQAALLRVLRAAVRRGEASHVQSLWIDNAIALHARPALITRLRHRADVRAIEPDRTLRIEPAALAATAAVPGASITATGAPALWAQGQTGRGVVVALMDTGIVPDFPQLASVPGAWFDPYGEHATPYDEDRHAHGTEVADIVVSMAPDVRVIAARVFSDGGRSTTSSVHRVFEWALDPDGDPRTDDAPSVVNGSWNDAPGNCLREFDADLAALRAAGVVPVFAAGNFGPGTGSGASPASEPGAVAVGSVSSFDVVSDFSGRGPSPCGGATFPTIAAYGEGIALQGPAGEAVVSGTSFAAPQVTGAVALLAGMFPGATPAAIVNALVQGARDVGTPGADDDTGAGVLSVTQAAALLAGADRAGPRVRAVAYWSHVASHPGLVLSGRASERGGGTGAGIVASAFTSRLGAPAAPFFRLSATPLGARDATLAGRLGARALRRLADGHWGLFVHARDAAGNWGPVQQVVLPVDRVPPSVRVSSSRHGGRVVAHLLVRDRDAGLARLAYRIEIAGQRGRWHPLRLAAKARLTLHVARGRRAILRLRAVDLVGNATGASFVLPR